MSVFRNRTIRLVLQQNRYIIYRIGFNIIIRINRMKVNRYLYVYHGLDLFFRTTIWFSNINFANLRLKCFWP